MPLSFIRGRYIWLQIQAASHLVNFLYPCRAIILAPKWNDPFVEIVTFLFHWRFTMAYSSCFCPVLAAYHILSLSCLLHKNSKDSSTCCLVFLGFRWCLLFFFYFVGLFFNRGHSKFSYASQIPHASVSTKIYKAFEVMSVKARITKPYFILALPK